MLNGILGFCCSRWPGRWLSEPMSTSLAMLHPELLDPDDIQAISRDDLIMALNRKVDLLTRNVAKAS